MVEEAVHGSVTVYCDGACEPRNPGGYGTWGWVMFAPDGSEVASECGSLGRNPSMTNNIAEYHALLDALKYAYHMPVVVEAFRTDSRLVVEQVNGTWRCKAAHLRPKRDEARRLLEVVGAKLEWVPREENERADALSREAYRKAKEAA